MGEETLFKMLKERPMSVSELARKLNMRREFLTGYLEALRDKGQVQRISVGRSHVYLPTQVGMDSSVHKRMAAVGEEEEE